MKYKPSEDIIFTPLRDNSGVLLRLSDTFFFSLNETGAIIWREIDKGAGIQEIVKALCAEFEISESEAMQDITAFIEDLKREKLIMEVEG